MTALLKHTPGPWVATLDRGVWCVHQAEDAPPYRTPHYNYRTGLLMRVPTNILIFRIAGEFGEADAKLAAAAPDLLAALQSCVRALRAEHMRRQTIPNLVVHAEDAIALAIRGAA